MSEVKLLPCPFCGGTDVGESHISTYSVDSSYDVFGCRSCGARFEGGSAAEWNTRANLAERDAEVEALRAEVELLRMGVCGDACLHIAIERDQLKSRAEQLAEALLEWWRGNRPHRWSIAKHCDHPAVNCNTDSEIRAAYVAAKEARLRGIKRSPRRSGTGEQRCVRT